MKIDLHRFAEKLKGMEAEDTVHGKEEVLPYLYNHILSPLLSGRLVRYGDIDFDAFEADDLRVLSYYPHRRADISYYSTEYTDFPLPQLVFSMRYDPDTHKATDIRLCVVKDEHLTPDTPTYYYPFSNVYGDKRICLGNNALPQYKDPTRIGGLAYHILHMPNNNDMFKPQHNKLELEYRELLEYLKDKDPACYYSEILVPDGKTLKHFIGGK